MKEQVIDVNDVIIMEHQKRKKVKNHLPMIQILEESKISLPQEGDVKEIVIKQETPPIQVEEKTKKLVNHTIVDNEPKKGVIFDNIIAMDEAIW